MLDPKHPRYKITMASRALDGAILEIARDMTLLETAERQALLPKCHLILNEMRLENRKHYENSPLYNEAIDELSKRLGELAALQVRSVTNSTECPVCGRELEIVGTYHGRPKEGIPPRPSYRFCMSCVWPSIEGLQKVRRVVEHGER